MSESSVKLKEMNDPSSQTPISLEVQSSDQVQPKVESSHQTEQPQLTLDPLIRQESDNAMKPDLDLMVDKLRNEMSAMSIKLSYPVDNHASSSSKIVLDDKPNSLASEKRMLQEFQGIALHTPYRRGPFPYGARRIPDKRLNRSHVKKSNHAAEREARRAALDIAEQRMKESEARILARQNKRLEVYSNPRIEHGVELAWPLLQYATRRAYDCLWPMIFFDITQDPSKPNEGAISLRFEGNQDLSKDLLSECMEMDFSPTTSFSLIKIRGQASELDHSWDVIVERSDGIRVIDVFSAIFQAYNVPLSFREKFYMRSLIDSSSSIDAYRRRSKSTQVRDQGMFRVDLLGKKTLFNGIFFDEETGQFYFRLTERHSDDITLSSLF